MANAVLTTEFHSRDFFNEIRYHHTSWEVAHPAIFIQLVSRRTKQWHWIDPDKSEYLEGLYYTILKQTTPFGLADIWVCCEDPKLFEFPTAPYSTESLWTWWNQWAQSAILISCPILHCATTQAYHSWNIRSKCFEWTMPECSTEALPSHFQHFFTKGCYTIASGQTLAMALHRENRIPTYLFLSLLQTSRQHWESIYEDNDAQWFINFSSNTYKMLLYIHTNILVGDYLLLYAMYGTTSPVILSYLLETTNISPVFSYLMEDAHQNVLLTAIYNTYYARRLSAPICRKSPTWYSYWKTICPYLSHMSLNRLRESPLYQQPVVIYGPEQPIYNNLMDIYLYMSYKQPFLDYVTFLQSEYHIGDHRLVYYLLTATFRAHPSKSKTQLYEYWSFIRDHYFSTADEWMRWVCRLMVYQYHRRTIVLPWRFFHWLFSDHPTFSVRLFVPYPVLFGNELYQRSLYDYLDLFQNDISLFSVPFTYKSRVLRPHIQARIRSLHQIKRTLPADITHVFDEYIRRHRDLVWN